MIGVLPFVTEMNLFKFLFFSLFILVFFIEASMFKQS